MGWVTHRFSVSSYNCLNRAKASATWRQRCDDNVPSALCLVGMSTTYVVDNSASNYRSQIFEFGSEWENHSIAAWVAVGYVFNFIRGAKFTGQYSGVYIFTVAYGVSFGPISWVLPNEVFPLSMRAKGASISTASNWTNNCMSRIYFFTPSFLIDDEMLFSPDWPHHAAVDGKLSCVSFQREIPVATALQLYLLLSYSSLTFGVFGSACFLAYLWATYTVPETANVSLEMIDEVFRCPANQEDIVVKRQVRTPL